MSVKIYERLHRKLTNKKLGKQAKQMVKIKELK